MLLCWYCLLALVTAGLFVIWTIPLVCTIALKFKKFDAPSARKVHQRPMVRLGGISICLGTLLAWLLVWGLGGFNTFPPEAVAKVAWVMAGGFAFFLIGITDDCINLSAHSRLVLQLGVAGLVWLTGVQIDFITLPGIGLLQLGWLSLPITALWLAGVVNAINWIDGLDGLASGVACIAAVVIFIVCLATGQFAAAIPVLALAGSLLGFLHYNFNPAKLFMGDGGSYFIGFVIAGVSVVGLVKGAAVSALLVPLLVLAVPLLDMVAVIVTRLRHGQSPFTADKRHLHHRLLSIGLSHRFTVLFIYAIALWAGSLAIAIVGIPNSLVLVTSTTALLAGTTWKAWQVAQES